MLHIVVFCLNRPILCDNLFRSINDHFVGDTQDISITLLYGATDEQYLKGFGVLRDRFAHNKITYVRKFQGHWRMPLSLLLRPRNLYYYLRYPYYRDTAHIYNFKSLLEEIIQESEHSCVTFLTDDSFFYRKVLWNKTIANLVSQDPEQHSFSLRHGLNLRNAPSDIRHTDKGISWNFAGRDVDPYWSYRFSIDGHIYDRRFLLSFIRRILYVNPNTFEAVVGRFAEVKHVLTQGHGFRESVLAGAEINRVQNVSANNNLGIDNVMLNTQYVKGFRLRLVLENEVREFHPHIERMTLLNQDMDEEVSLL